MAQDGKIPVGVIGATGMVGQNYLRLLEDHPWFEVVHVAASPQSVGKAYENAVSGRWLMKEAIPRQARSLTVADVRDVEAAMERCKFIFSAVAMEKQAVREIENEYAQHLPVISNNAAHRQTEDVPVIIPEINAQHLEIIPEQQRQRGWSQGFLVVKPNCSVQSFLPPVYALIAAGYPVEKLVITTFQAVSGAGYPGPASLDMIDNVIPYIPGEEQKTEQEPLKILGTVQEGKIKQLETLSISAHCTRVPVTDGHLVCVSLKFADQPPGIKAIKEIWESFEGEPQKLKLPSAPHPLIVVRDEDDRPQIEKDRGAGKGMAVTVGRLRAGNVLDIRFASLSHNTVRGAAGGAILTAELLKVRKYL